MGPWMSILPRVKPRAVGPLPAQIVTLEIPAQKTGQSCLDAQLPYVIPLIFGKFNWQFNNRTKTGGQSSVASERRTPARKLSQRHSIFLATRMVCSLVSRTWSKRPELPAQRSTITLPEWWNCGKGAVSPIATRLRSAQLSVCQPQIRQRDFATQPGRLSDGSCKSVCR